MHQEMPGVLGAAMREKELKYHFQMNVGKQNICLFYPFWGFIASSIRVYLVFK